VVNLVAAEGNPPEVMDVNFAGQALALRWLARDHAGMAAGVHAMPPDIDAEVARLTLESSGARIDTLTQSQRDYLSSWRTVLRAPAPQSRPGEPAPPVRPAVGSRAGS
jgi:adenosylhomocysteinase